MKRAVGSIALLPAFLITGAASAAKETIPYEWNGVERIVAVGDLHGAFENFVNVLKNTGLVDEKLRWIGGKTHLVQVGDVVDRGADSRKCMDLLMRLEKEAEKAGGYVHALIGNHEAMNVVGILDYASAEEFASYDNAQGRKVRNRAFAAYFEEKKNEAKASGTEAPSTAEAKERFDAEHARGYFGHRLAFGPDGRYGKWIRGHNVSVRINGVVFSHGDWSEEISPVGIAEMNRRVRDELSGRLPIQDGLTFHLKGPLQYRGLSEIPLTRQQQENFTPVVDRILSNLKAKRMVVGHTTTDGAIEPRFGCKHISIDAGMLEIYQGGHRVALEIQGDSLEAVHPDGKVELPGFLDESNYLEYAASVAAVDPANVNVHRALAERFLQRGEFDKARQTLEKLYRTGKSLPFRYHRLLGDVYQGLGQSEKALEQYLLFISGLESLIDANPGNPYIRNTLARFCLEQNLKLDTAAENLDAVLRLDPHNPTFLLTRGRLHVARRNYAEAAADLEKAVQGDNPGYDAYYYLGLSYLGLHEPERARSAFEKAIEADPMRLEAREELRKLNESSQRQGGGHGHETRDLDRVHASIGLDSRVGDRHRRGPIIKDLVGKARGVRKAAQNGRGDRGRRCRGGSHQASEGHPQGWRSDLSRGVQAHQEGPSPGVLGKL